MPNASFKKRLYNSFLLMFEIEGFPRCLWCIFLEHYFRKSTGFFCDNDKARLKYFSVRRARFARSDREAIRRELRQQFGGWRAAASRGR